MGGVGEVVVGAVGGEDEGGGGAFWVGCGKEDGGGEGWGRGVL